MSESTSKKATKGALYCRPQYRGKPRAGRTSNKWCPECKMKVRGPGHAEGEHHRKKARQKGTQMYWFYTYSYKPIGAEYRVFVSDVVEGDFADVVDEVQDNKVEKGYENYVLHFAKEITKDEFYKLLQII